MTKSRLYSKFALGTGALLLFLLLAFLVSHHTTLITTIDQGAINLLHPLVTPTLTAVIAFISNLASPAMMTVYSLIIAVFLGRYHEWYTGLNFLLTFSALTLLNHVVKELIERPRPLHRLVSIGGFSFPSGHTFSTLILVFTGLALLKKFQVSPQKLHIVLVVGWLVIILIAFTRVYLHAHFVSDTVGSLLLATASWQLLTASFAVTGHQLI